MDFKELSIKNFMGDLPRIINENFAKLAKFLGNLYDEENERLVARNVEAEGEVTANTVNVNNLIIKVNGKDYSLAQVIEKLERLEDKVETLTGDASDPADGGY